MEGDAAAGDLGEDVFGGRGPDWLGVVVVGVEVDLDGGDQIGHRVEDPAT